MGITQFQFTFQGDKETFVNEVKRWIRTPEGKGYKIKKRRFLLLQSQFFLELNKGNLLAELFLNTGFTRLEFTIAKETNDCVEILTNGYRLKYTIFFIPIKGTLTEKAGRLTGARKKGWNDMISLLSFLGVENYNHSFK